MVLKIKRSNILISIFILLGFILSLFQFFGISPDYNNYENFFILVRDKGFNIFNATRFEPGFVVLSILIGKISSSSILLYSYIVVIALAVKGYVIKAYTTKWHVIVIVVLFYLARYFSLHEITQLRAACATSLVLLSTVLIWKGRLYSGWLIFALSVLFHFSSLVLIPAILLKSTSRLRAVLVIVIVFIFTILFVDLLTSYLATYINILNIYQNNQLGEKPNPFAIQLLIDLAIIAVSLIYWNKLTPLMRRVIFIEMFGLAIFYGAFEIVEIAHRVREFYSVFWIFFVIEGLQIKGARLLTISFVVLVIFWYSYIFFVRGFFNA
jgi:hypothetical protein